MSETPAAVRVLADQPAAPKVPFGLAAKSDDQTAAWGIKDDSDLVVVLYNRMRVVKRWEFQQGAPPSDAQLQEIVTEVSKVAAGS